MSGQSTLTEYGESIVGTLRTVSRGDVLRVNDDEELRVHRNGEYFGPVVVEAYRADGSRANIGIEDGTAWIGCSQLRDPGTQIEHGTRIRSVTIVETRGEDR